GAQLRACPPRGDRPMRLPLRARRLLVGAALLGAVGGVGTYLRSPAPAVPESRDLRPFLRARPPVAVVFTSRTEPTSFQAAAPEAEGFHFPGTIPWAAREGRLRLLDAAGRGFELTRGGPPPHRPTLIA